MRMPLSFLHYLCLHRPAITTEEDGSLRFTSEGDLVFQAGDGGQVQFMTADGPLDMVGQKVSVWWQLQCKQ